MGLADLTRESVLGALREYDEIGGEAFRARYGYGEAREYLIHWDGKTYDSKAIAGVAHGHLAGRSPLRADEFSGGEATVVRRLRRLGFYVPPQRSPKWSRDEVILVCDMVAQNDWKYMADTDPRAIEMSALLQTLPIHPAEVRSDNFRNPSGVARKTADIVTHRPDYQGSPTKGGAIDKVVLNEFLADPPGMHALAVALRKAIEDDTLAGQLEVALDDEDHEASEGRLLQRKHFVRERNPKLRRAKIAQFLKKNNRVCCEACSFDFEAVYGPRGQGYIEVHHTRPLHDSGQTTTNLNDLVLLCANCHRIIHCKSPWLTFKELCGLVGRD